MSERRAQVLQAAIELLDEVGLDGLTMRLLASRLGVRAGALYRHYPSKQALLDAMVAHLVVPPGEAVPPLDGPWDERLRLLAIGTRELMLAHRDGARLMSTFQNPGSEAVAFYHDLIATLTTAGVPADTAAAAVDTVMAYVNGYTTEEQARSIATQPREFRDRTFRAGLELIITGTKASLP
ncbi:TetR/AcrR family transcriptional regulator C-terminal domain-containing protein [Nonomuraea sp. NPDC052129]|uniref:TetR/AcrR family transcriptional regulator C-terminal domain-containing protein n=1 Tax=Nonomuraea sp. NPDC052129 TaxID=3154651 RepID=UPI00344823D2